MQMVMLAVMVDLSITLEVVLDQQPMESTRQTLLMVVLDKL
jgi:hypothetical protein